MGKNDFAKRLKNANSERPFVFNEGVSVLRLGKETINRLNEPVWDQD
jgi:hypothetical protein